MASSSSFRAFITNSINALLHGIRIGQSGLGNQDGEPVAPDGVESTQHH
jgi:hypothetical protein